MAVTWIVLILSIFMMEKTHGQIQMDRYKWTDTNGQIQMDRYKWCGVEPGSDIVLSILSESKNRLLNRYNLYYNIFIAKLTWR